MITQGHYKARDVAKYIIKTCAQKDLPISNLKLQKLLYFVQAEFLVTRHMACFKDEIAAWDFGPVVPTVYYEYHMFGAAGIPYKYTDEIISINRKDAKLIDGIIEHCAQKDSAYLTKLSMNQTPWKKTKRGSVVSLTDIYTFFMEDNYES